ncbi:unnamed protein product [Closterium sp. Yama58-4]|nr:unnamed protein product [Closterium sp. Yama58-4]
MPPPPSSMQHRPSLPHHLPPLPVPQWRSGPAGKPMPSSSLWPPHAPAGSFPQPFVPRDYIHSALPLPHSYPPPDWVAGGGNDAIERGSGGGGRRFKRRSSRQSGPPVPHPLGLDYGGPPPRGSRMRRPDKQAQGQGQAQARQPRQPRQAGQLRQQQQHKKIWKRRRAPGPGFASAAAAAAAEVNGSAAPLAPLSLPSPGDAEGMLEDGEFRPPRLQELKQRNRVGTRSAPRNTTSFIMQARGGAGPLTPAGAGASGVGAGASPSPATTPRLLPTPLASSSPAPWGVGLSSSQDGAGEGDIREFRVNPYGSMNGMLYTGDTAGANGMMPHHPVMGMAARGSSGDSFLRARIDEQETQLAQLEEENLTLRERLYVAEQEVKELRRRLGEGSDEMVEMGGDNSDDEASCAAAHPAAA